LKNPFDVMSREIDLFVGVSMSKEMNNNKIIVQMIEFLES